MKNFKLLVFLGILFLAASCGRSSAPLIENPAPQPSTSTPSAAAVQPLLFEPLTNSLARITKKPFGIYITPQTSPVQPEKFRGYHTGADFEIFDDEIDKEVPVSAVCAGPLLLKRTATGYGGVAVQACQLEGNDVTVVYGHLKFSSISPKIGDQIEQGQKLGILGKGYSTETDGERKHLHLSIHKGKSVVLLGYVQNKNELNNWLDPAIYLK